MPEDSTIRARRDPADRAFATPRWPGRTPLAVACAAAVLAAAGCGGSGATGPNALLRSVSAPTAIAPAKGVAWISSTSDPARNRVYVTWSQSKGDDLRVFVAASRDGGRTFSRPVWVARERAGQQSNVRVDGAGRVYVAWTHFDFRRRLNPKDQYSNPSWQRVAVSDDGGSTFSRPADVVRHTERAASAFGTLSVALRGRTVSVEWLDYLPVNDPRVAPVGRDAARVLAATSRDGGRTFAPPVQVARTACVCCEPFGFMQHEREALLFRGWAPGTKQHDIRDIKLTARGQAGEWSVPRDVHADRFLIHHCPSVGPSGAVDARNRLHVAWWTGASGRAGYWYAVQDERGRFSKPVEVESHPLAPNENNATVAVDGRGIAWTATVGHGQYSATSDKEDTSPNRVRVYAIRPGDRAELVSAAGTPGASPQLASVTGAVVQTWVQDGRIRARRLVTS